MSEQQECCDRPRGFVGGTCDYCEGTVQPEETSHHITFKLRHRLASENPRIVEYCFSDRPDEIFTDRDLLIKHRGLTHEELQQTVTIIPTHTSL
jgi:hypothetical protein